MAKTSSSRTFIFSLLLIALLVTFTLVAYYLVYQNSISQLSGYKRFYEPDYEAPVYPLLTERQVLNLGWAHRKKENKPTRSLGDPKEPKLSYLHFPFEKKEGVFRIGTFGDSFTEGVEAGHGFDYPSLLQENFNRAGVDSVEVINFGVGGYGVHQSYLLFDYLGSKYDLDAIVFQPFFFHYTRDNSFTYEHDYLPVHARYVLQDDTLKLLEVLGNSMQETADIYHSFLSKNQYLKYDIKTPNFLKPVFSDFNPFYYTGAKTGKKTEEELLKTYSVILDRFAGRVKRVIIICHDTEIYKLKENVTKKNIDFFQSGINEAREISNSLYTAPVEHFSPLGNQFVADELFNLFLGRQDSLSFIKLAFVDSSVVSPNGVLTDYDEIFFRIEDADFHLYTRQGQEASNIWSIPFNLKKSGANSFLLLSDKLSDIRLMPLTFTPKDGDKVTIDRDKEIGKLVSLNPYVFRIVLADNLSMKQDEKGHVLETIIEVFGKDARLFFADDEVDLKAGNPYEAIIRSQGREYFDIHHSNGNGEVMMVIKKGMEEKLFSFLKWKREKISVLNPNYISPPQP